MQCASKRKPPRANIVFLQADRSKSEEENIFDEPIVEENGIETFYVFKKNLIYDE